jgi:hypothetical protein
MEWPQITKSKDNSKKTQKTDLHKTLYIQLCFFERDEVTGWQKTANLPILSDFYAVCSHAPNISIQNFSGLPCTLLSAV